MPVGTYAGYVKSRPHRHAPDRRSCRDTEQQTLPAHRDCLFDIKCEVDRLVAQQPHGCSPLRAAIRLQNALSSIQGFVPDQRTLRGVYRTLIVRGVYQLLPPSRRARTRSDPLERLPYPQLLARHPRSCRCQCGVLRSRAHTPRVRPDPREARSRHVPIHL